MYVDILMGSQQTRLNHENFDMYIVKQKKILWQVQKDKVREQNIYRYYTNMIH